MTSRTRFASLLLVAGLALAACGGSAQANAPTDQPADAGPASSAPAADANGASNGGDAGVEGGVDTPAAGASNMTISSVIETTITGMGYCAANNIEAADRDFGFDNLRSDFDYENETMWMLSIDIEDYAGAGTYETTDDASGKASISLSDGMGTSFSAGPDAGTMVVADGDESGSLDVTLTNDDTGETVTVTGDFACEA